MKNLYRCAVSVCTVALVLLTSCSKKQSNVWEGEQKTTSAHDKGDLLWGNSEELSQNARLGGLEEEEFIPLDEQDLHSAFGEMFFAQPVQTTEKEESLFLTKEQSLAVEENVNAIFPTLHFNTDEHVLRDQQDLAALERMASHLKEHGNLYLFIEGHCDERGPEAYNLSLGTRRANYVRSVLIKKGIDASRLHTISYGKEKPITLGHDAHAWRENRRVQFKILNKS